MKTMRLDKFLSETKTLSRKEADIEIKRGNITVNGEVAQRKEQKVSTEDNISFHGKQIFYSKFIYIMLNKPQGYVSSTDDPRDKTVLDLLPEQYQKYDLFPCGRLDKDTVGLVILTNDGVSAHNLLSPKKHVSKNYYFEIADEISSEQICNIEQGITLRDGYTTKPCKIEMNTQKSGTITLTEGKYHEIKRLFGSQGNKITYLKRVSFGDILLDENLKESEYRLLTSSEEQYFTHK